MKDMESKGSFKIRVKSGENEIEIQYPLKEASNKACGNHCTDYIDKESILTAYPLTNIK